MKHTIQCPDCKRISTWEDNGNPCHSFDQAMIQCVCGNLWANYKGGWFDSIHRLTNIVDRFTGNDQTDNDKKE